MPKIWTSLKDLNDAADRLEDLSRILSFITDLLSHGKSGDYYTFSRQGYCGMYILLRLIQEEMEGCMEAILKTKEVK